MDNITRITTEAGSRLVGALIGLVRATDGAVHVTDDTYNIIIEGLHASDIALNLSDDEVEAITNRAHADKQVIVPDCSVCGSPCGRTADYDWETVYREGYMRIGLLSKLQQIAHRIVSGEIDADNNMRFILCKAVFALGEDWSADELGALDKELDVYCSAGDCD